MLRIGCQRGERLAANRVCKSSTLPHTRPTRALPKRTCEGKVPVCTLRTQTDRRLRVQLRGVEQPCVRRTTGYLCEIDSRSRSLPLRFVTFRIHRDRPQQVRVRFVRLPRPVRFICTAQMLGGWLCVEHRSQRDESDENSRAPILVHQFTWLYIHHTHIG